MQLTTTIMPPDLKMSAVRRCQPPPPYRPLQIYALDPMRFEDTGSGFLLPRVTINVEYEPLALGPIGARFQVIDYDGSRDVFYDPVDLDDPHLLLSHGLRPTETDPHFHQQMVYAVVSSVWTAFEAALGRRIGLSTGPLRIFPHAFYGENAFYNPRAKALLFGYFQADDTNPGANLPGQFVFSCLSHDIIAHETTHAIVDRLRPHFDEMTNPDVPAFHEAFADLVAIFRHFTLEEVLREAINTNKADLTSADVISDLARQFGFALAQNRALRQAFEEDPDPGRYARTTEAHSRGVILVQAVFAAYQTTYLARVQDLLRLATGGSGILPEGRPHPDLVRRLAREARETADLFFQRCVQAFTYLPPVDVTFSDFLRAIVTVDSLTAPADDSFRTSVIEACRRRGIYATTAGSLGESAVALPVYDQPEIQLPSECAELIKLSTGNLGEYRRSKVDSGVQTRVGNALGKWIKQLSPEQLVALGLAPYSNGAHPIQVAGFHSTLRFQVSGQPWVDTVVQLVQRRPDLEGQAGEVVPKAAATIVADAVGNVRHVVSKKMGLGSERLDTMRRMVEAFDRNDGRAAYRDANEPDRLKLSFARLHGTSDVVEDG